MATEQQPSPLDTLAARLGRSPDELREMAERAVGSVSNQAAKEPGHGKQTANDLREFRDILEKHRGEGRESAAEIVARIPDPQEKARAETLFQRLAA